MVLILAITAAWLRHDAHRNAFFPSSLDLLTATAEQLELSQEFKLQRESITSIYLIRKLQGLNMSIVSNETTLAV